MNECFHLVQIEFSARSASCGCDNGSAHADRMKTMNRAVTAIMLLLTTTAAASAHDYRGYDTQDVDARRADQMRRIEDGRRSGQLSWREYRFLRREQAQIAADERRAKADGNVSSYERRRLNRELNEASQDIHRLKHNDEVARWNRWW
jgi:uncharacterized membrane protein YebE (DUF533 family)